MKDAVIIIVYLKNDMDLYEESVQMTEVDAHHNYSTPSQAYYNFLKSLLGLGRILC